MRLVSGFAAALGGVLLTAGSARAVSFAGSSSAAFGEPTPAENNSGVGTNEVRFGLANDPNSLGFTGGAFASSNDTPFTVATLTYHNGTSSFEFVDIPAAVQLSFSDPAGLVRTFPFGFRLHATDNLTGDPVLDADTLSVVGAFSPVTFDVNGQTYTLEIKGFSADGGQTTTTAFTLPEGQTTQSQLMGAITAPQAAPIPEPAAAWLLLLGLGGLALRRRGGASVPLGH